MRESAEERSCRDGSSVYSEKLRKIVRGGVSERVVAKRGKFVFNSRAGWQPVKLSEKRLCMHQGIRQS